MCVFVLPHKTQILHHDSVQEVRHRPEKNKLEIFSPHSVYSRTKRKTLFFSAGDSKERAQEFKQEGTHLFSSIGRKILSEKILLESHTISPSSQHEKE